MIGFVTAGEDFSAHSNYRPAVAIYGRAPVSEGRPLPCFGSPGTGGLATLQQVMFGQGYRPYTIVETEVMPRAVDYAPYAVLMEEVKTGFGRTMSHLPVVFGVSRQSLYNWIAGEAPKEQHQQKIIQLAAAARIFTQEGFKPTALMLDRVIGQGKSFLEQMSEGGDGAEAANKLIRIVNRGMVARDKLDALLGDRKPAAPATSDMGRQSFNENT